MSKSVVHFKWKIENILQPYYNTAMCFIDDTTFLFTFQVIFAKNVDLWHFFCNKSIKNQENNPQKQPYLVFFVGNKNNTNAQKYNRYFESGLHFATISV
jgi:hypothetical protein